MKVDDALNNLPLATVYVVHGNNEFSKWQLRKKLERSTRNPRVVVFGDDFDLLDKAECGGLLPEAKLVIVNDFSEIKNKKEFYELIERSAEGSIYVLLSSKKEKITTSKSVVEIDCPAVKHNEKDFVNLLKTWLKNSSFNLNDVTLRKIYKLSQGDLFYAFHEIQKLSLYAHGTNSAHISNEDVDKLIGPKFEADPFIFSTYYLQKKINLALSEIGTWKTTDVMLQLHNQFKAVEKALLVKSCKNKGFKSEKITDETGIPLWYMKYTFPEIDSKWSEKDLIVALKDCTMAIRKAKKISNLAIPVMVESTLRLCRFGESVE